MEKLTELVMEKDETVPELPKKDLVGFFSIVLSNVSFQSISFVHQQALLNRGILSLLLSVHAIHSASQHLASYPTYWMWLSKLTDR